MSRTANVEDGRAMQLADNLLLQYVCVLIAFKLNTVSTHHDTKQTIMLGSYMRKIQYGTYMCTHALRKRAVKALNYSAQQSG